MANLWFIIGTIILSCVDRGNDNWLIKCQRPQTEDDAANKEVGLVELHDMLYTSYSCSCFLHQQDVGSHKSGDSSNKSQGHIQIAAIDNGLAFPFKHPDSWRTCKVYFLLTLQYNLRVLDTFKFVFLVLYCKCCM